MRSIKTRIATIATAVLTIGALSIIGDVTPMHHFIQPANAATKLCANNLASCGFPNSNSTGYGVPLSKLKVENYAIDLNTPGEHLSYVTTDHQINVDAPNVTIDHVRVVVKGDDFGIRLNRAAKNTTIEHAVIRGYNSTASGASGEAIKDVYGTGGSATLKWLNIYNFGDGPQIYAGRIAQCYIHGLIDANGWHLEDVNENGNGTNASLAINHNTLLNSSGQTAAIYIGADFDPSQNVSVTKNLMAGGGYTFYGGGHGVGSQANPKNIVVENNIFSKLYYSNYGYWGPVAYFDSGNGDVWSNNRQDNGTKTGGTLIGG